MISRIFLAACFIVSGLVFGNTVSLADEIYLLVPRTDSSVKPAKEIKYVRGAIKEEEMTPGEVVIYSSSKGSDTVETFNVDYIKFDHEPKEYDQIREHITQGDYKGAQGVMQAMIAAAKAKKTDLSFDNNLIKLEFEYFTAYLQAMAVISGQADTAGAGPAAGALLKFFQENKTHYRYYQGAELVVLLSQLVPNSKLETTKKFYDVLAAAPSKEYKARATLLYARALIAEGRGADAAPILATLANEKSNSPLLTSLVQQAKIAQAQVLAQGGKPDDAIKQLEQIVNDTPIAERETHAWAYATMGNIYNAKQAKSDALLSFMKIDLLLANANPDLHAEALSKLAVLWNEIVNRKPDSATQAKEKLNTMYPFSRWNK